MNIQALFASSETGVTQNNQPTSNNNTNVPISLEAARYYALNSGSLQSFVNTNQGPSAFSAIPIPAPPTATSAASSLATTSQIKNSTPKTKKRKSGQHHKTGKSEGGKVGRPRIYPGINEGGKVGRPKLTTGINEGGKAGRPKQNAGKNEGAKKETHKVKKASETSSTTNNNTSSSQTKQKIEYQAIKTISTEEDFKSIINIDVSHTWKLMFVAITQTTKFHHFFQDTTNNQENYGDILSRILLSRTIDSNFRLFLLRKLLLINKNLASVKHKDSLPIHHIVRNIGKIDFASRNEIVDILIQAYPHGLVVGDGLQQTPLHISCFRGSSVKEVKKLLLANVSAATVQDHTGNLPIHAALCRKCTPDKFKALYNAYPESLFVENNRGFNPITLANNEQIHSNANLIHCLKKLFLEAQNGLEGNQRERVLALFSSGDGRGKMKDGKDVMDQSELHPQNTERGISVSNKTGQLPISNKAGQQSEPAANQNNVTQKKGIEIPSPERTGNVVNRKPSNLHSVNINVAKARKQPEVVDLVDLSDEESNSLELTIKPERLQHHKAIASQLQQLSQQHQSISSKHQQTIVLDQNSLPAHVVAALYNGSISLTQNKFLKGTQTSTSRQTTHHSQKQDHPNLSKLLGEAQENHRKQLRELNEDHDKLLEHIVTSSEQTLLTINENTKLEETLKQEIDQLKQALQEDISHNDKPTTNITTLNNDVSTLRDHIHTSKHTQMESIQTMKRKHLETLRMLQTQQEESLLISKQIHSNQLLSISKQPNQYSSSSSTRFEILCNMYNRDMTALHFKISEMDDCIKQTQEKVNADREKQHAKDTMMGLFKEKRCLECKIEYLVLKVKKQMVLREGDHHDIDLNLEHMLDDVAPANYFIMLLKSDRVRLLEKIKSLKERMGGDLVLDDEKLSASIGDSHDLDMTEEVVECYI